mgnify:CR=1 FL=1
MTRFKICGLREARHAVTAAESGASFLGFVFVQGVRRQLTEKQGKDIIAGYRKLSGEHGPALVGLLPIRLLKKSIVSC